MAIQKVLKYDDEKRGRELGLKIETSVDVDCKDEPSRFEANLLNMEKLNSRFDFMLSEIKELVCKR